MLKGAEASTCLLARFLCVAPLVLCYGALADAAAWCLGWPALPCTTTFSFCLTVLTVRASVAHPPAAWAAHYLAASTDAHGRPDRFSRLFGALVNASCCTCHNLSRLSRRATAAAVVALSRRRLRRAPPRPRGGETEGGTEHSLVLALSLPHLATDDAARCAVLSRRLQTAAASLPTVDFDDVVTPGQRVMSAVVQTRCSLAGRSLRRLTLTTLPLPVRDVLNALAAAPCVEELETFCGEPPCGSVPLLTTSPIPFLHGQQPLWSPLTVSQLVAAAPKLRRLCGCVSGPLRGLTASLPTLPPCGALRLFCSVREPLRSITDAVAPVEALCHALTCGGGGGGAVVTLLSLRFCRLGAGGWAHLAVALPRCHALVELRIVDGWGQGPEASAALPMLRDAAAANAPPVQLSVSVKNPEYSDE